MGTLTVRLQEITTNKQINMTFNTLRRQILFYQTTIDNCQCGDNKIESSLYRIDIPCVHRIKLGAKFPECPRVKLVLNEKFDKLIIDYNPVIPDDLLNTYDEEHLNKEYAIKIIKRHSKYKKKEEIIEYVNHAYCSANDAYFISGKPVTLIQLIDEVIEIFTEKEKQRKSAKT